MLTRSVLVIEDEVVVALLLPDNLTDLQLRPVAISGCDDRALAARQRPARAGIRLRNTLDSLDTAHELGARHRVAALPIVSKSEPLETAPADAFAQG